MCHRRSSPTGFWQASSLCRRGHKILPTQFHYQVTFLFLSVLLSQNAPLLCQYSHLIAIYLFRCRIFSLTHGDAVLSLVAASSRRHRQQAFPCHVIGRRAGRHVDNTSAATTAFREVSPCVSPHFEELFDFSHGTVGTGQCQRASGARRIRADGKIVASLSLRYRGTVLRLIFWHYLQLDYTHCRCAFRLIDIEMTMLCRWHF